METMKLTKILPMTLMVLFLCSAIALAGDFEWMRGFNVEAGADQSGFRARLSARFQVGDAAINAAIGNTDNPADAYACLRLGEISHQPIERVISEYKKGKGKGWGNIAKSLGIKPGSSEFHALKQGHDLYDDEGYGGGKAKGKGKGKGKK
jgi:hypothetical protein